MVIYRKRLDHIIDDDIRDILIAPLNWGLGHATRCIPIIEYFIEKSKNVTLASDGEALEILISKFPNLEYISIPSYNVTYKSTRDWLIAMMNLPNVLNAIIAEHWALRKILKRKKFDLILSDSRFGFRHHCTKSFIISHQLNLQSSSKIFAIIMNKINQSLLGTFDKCLIPDFEDHRLSGVLSKNKNIKNSYFIGPLSRFKKSNVSYKYDKAFILSGPEPARSLLEKIILKNILNTREKIIIVRGTNRRPHISVENQNITIRERLETATLNRVILESKHIYSRSGYTSIMDYYTLGIGAFLIPTRGQTEQEYLADLHHGKHGMIRIENEEIPKIIS